MRVIFKNAGLFKVQSESKPNNFYEVDLRFLTDGTCQCKAFKRSGVFCKHIKEVRARLRDNGKGIEGL
jgi:hypothetical protein